MTRGPDLSATYRRALGPWAYERDHLGYRFLVFYHYSARHPVMEWARARIRQSPWPVVVVLHHFPRRAWLESLWDA